jgi:hypothetical protein
MLNPNDNINPDVRAYIDLNIDEKIDKMVEEKVRLIIKQYVDPLIE